MMADARQLLADALASLDAASTLEHYEVNKALDLAGKAAKESGETVNELRFEFIATRLTIYDEPSGRGTYFGQIFGDPKQLDSVTGDCIAYWSTRMKTAHHPALRARYADLVWDLSEKATRNKPTIDAAHIAIDGYAEAMTTYPQMSSHSWGDIRKRIIDLALSINDEARLRTAVAANVAYANAEVEKDESEFRHRSLFAILRSIPPKRRPQAEFQAVVDDFRRRVETLDAEGADQFSMDRDALPLADHYWSSQQQDEAKKVMRMYGAAVERMAAKTTMATLGVGWLKQLYELYLRFEMNDEAKRVLKRIEVLQPGVPKDLVPISTSQHFTKEEIDKWLNWLVTDDVDPSFANLETHFLPQLDELRRQLDDIKKDFPLSQLFTATLVDHKGRAVAEVDPNDTEGKLIQHVNQSIQFRNTFLELGLKHLFQKHSIGPDELFARVIESPVWHEQRHAILRRGIDAVFAGDSIVAVHILVTEIENAVRIIAAGLGLTLQKQNRMGGFDLKNLGDFLADETVAAFLTEDLATYLRVVLTDRRGWNLRNGTCHGILPATSFTPAASQRLLHIVLLLSAVRTKKDAAAPTEHPHKPSSSPETPPEGGE
jgi:hypothetical protein